MGQILPPPVWPTDCIGKDRWLVAFWGEDGRCIGSDDHDFCWGGGISALVRSPNFFGDLGGKRPVSGCELWAGRFLILESSMSAVAEPDAKTCRVSADRDTWLQGIDEVAEEATASSIVVDLAAIERVGTRELNELLRLQVRLRRSGRRLVLAEPQPSVLEVFLLTRLDRVFEIHHSS